MKFYRCKCGKREAWTSGMVPKDCEGCPECNTTLAMDASGHKSPVPPHDIRVEKRLIDDKVVEIRTFCSVCQHTISTEHPQNKGSYAEQEQKKKEEAAKIRAEEIRAEEAKKLSLKGPK